MFTGSEIYAGKNYEPLAQSSQLRDPTRWFAFLQAMQ